MKKSFESGKIWTFLSAFIFMMMCGLFVLAVNTTLPSSKAGTWFNKYTTESLKQTSDERDQAILTAEYWDDIMSGLNDMIIPHGAIMAFTGECPAGWTHYEAADDRFLMGALTSFGKTDGMTGITLTWNQLPAHSHYFEDTIIVENNDVFGIPNNGGTNTKGGEPGYIRDDYNSMRKVSGNYGVDENTQLKTVIRTTSNILISSGGPKHGLTTWADYDKEKYSNSSIDITNPYIKVNYCIKD